MDTPLPCEPSPYYTFPDDLHFFFFCLISTPKFLADFRDDRAAKINLSLRLVGYWSKKAQNVMQRVGKRVPRSAGGVPVSIRQPCLPNLHTGSVNIYYL